MDEKKKMLVDCYERTLGTEESEPYREIVLSETAGGLILEVYENGGTPEESCHTYPTDRKCYEDVLTLIRKYDLASWNDREGTALEGKKLVCRFYDGQQYLRVSSENMAPDGERAFTEISSCLYKGIRKKGQER
ncbi:MAG: hypothetical protein IKE21_03435 [Erysipelotrichaceae bacterium]|nr:hypothetical protein [Erysipelotrichaceae bacterium]